MQLQILSKKLIKPTNPTPPNLRRLKISSIDQFHPPLYLSYIFCYPVQNQDDRAHNPDRINQLQKSLSEILTLYYPLAGRYIKHNLSIDCNDDGVQFSETKIDSNLAPFLVNDADCKQLIRFVQRQTESASAPLVSVQCNVFECGGLVVGVNISHRFFDGIDFAKFLNGWAEVCRIGIHEVNRPEFNLFSLLPVREVLSENKYLPPFKPGLKLSSKTFVFNHLLSNLRKYFKLTRLQLVTGVIWKALTRASEARHGKLRPSVIAHMLSLRRRTPLPISDDCCGNLMMPVIARFTPEKKKSYYNLEFQDFSFLLRQAITNVVNECRKLKNGDDLFSTVKNAWGEANREFDREEADTYLFTSGGTMPFHLDFGWGKSTRACHVQSEVEMIVLVDSRDGDGIEARIYLDEITMQFFEQDHDIIAFTSQEQQQDHPIFLRSRC
ncbi:Vinorine synthase [Melia azedarach]|uniref:Vinorine synthase n=1 Tax=Melia azedarach TaxID=155640 RepID=A0ACC1YJX4_MELAZ|nr:Vinorine synthase [Melia azedarach]